jgi:phage terminase large subunit
VADWDAEDRATLEAEGIPTIAADKRVKVGIEAVQHRLERAGDGKPRLFVFRNALVETDPDLVDAKKPTCLADEIDGYVWADKDNKDEPVKRDDHAADCLRYACMNFDSPGAFGFSDVSLPAKRQVLVARTNSRSWTNDNKASNNRWRLE